MGNDQVFDLLESLTQKAIAKYRLQPDDAHDVASESVLTVWRNYTSIRGAVNSYAFGVLRNKVIEFHRSRRHDSLADRSYVDPSSKNGGDFVRRDAKQDVATILQYLSKAEKQLLRFTHSLSTREIAELFQRSPRTIRHRLAQIRKKIENRFPEFKDSIPCRPYRPKAHL